jgi:hypothetical protein
MYLIDDLIVTTHTFITNACVPDAQSSVHEAKQLGPVPLAWSAALRVSQEIIIQTTIAYVVLFLSNISSNYILFLESEKYVSNQFYESWYILHDRGPVRILAYSMV